MNKPHHSCTRYRQWIRLVPPLLLATSRMFEEWSAQKLFSHSFLSPTFEHVYDMTQSIAVVVVFWIWVGSHVLFKCAPLVCNPSFCWNHNKRSTSSVTKPKVKFPFGSLLMSPFWFLNPFSVVVVGGGGVVWLLLEAAAHHGIKCRCLWWEVSPKGYTTFAPSLHRCLALIFPGDAPARCQ